MRAALTTDFLRRGLPKTPCEIYDSKLPGFLIRVRRSGRAYWAVVIGRGKGGKVTLGRVGLDPGLMTPTKARELAQSVIGQAAKDKALGVDPRAALLERRARIATPTLSDFLQRKYTPWATVNLETGDEIVARIKSVFAAMLKKPIHEITTFRLEQWRSARRRAGIAESTIDRDLNALRGALSKALVWKVISQHPMRDVKQAKTDRIGRLRYLSAEEEQRLRAALTARDQARRDSRERFNVWRAERGYQPLPAYGTYPDHLTPIVLLALNTGLRRGELFALDWKGDIDLVANLLTVRGSSAKDKETRHLPLNTEALEVLRTWQASSGNREGLVFPGPTAEPMTDLKTAWLKLVKGAQVTNFTFHDLRHTFASKLVQAGVDLNVVRELLGHSDIRMTLRYAHLAPQQKAAAVAKLVAVG